MRELSLLFPESYSGIPGNIQKKYTKKMSCVINALKCEV